MKAEASAGANAVGKELAIIHQSFMLDPLAPLTFVIEKHNKQEAPSPNNFQQASQAAAELLGYASTRISHLRREKIVGDVNKALLPLAVEDDNFTDAPPYLFDNELA